MKEQHCNGVPIPQRMRKLKRFAGMPIPYTTWVHPLTHVPDFKINDEKRRQFVIAQRRCSMCGERMNEKIAFIGGPASVAGNRCFIDAGMHPQCALFAWRVCPYIVHGRKHAAKREIEGAVVVELAIVPTDAPERMGMMITTSYAPFVQNGYVYVRAGEPESVVWRTFEKASAT